jgi:recombination protein RecA
MEDTQRLGSAARMMSQALRVLVSEVGRADATILFTNQVRDKPGVMWGEKTTTPGGRALRFYASIRVDIRGVGQEKDGEVVTSMHTKALIKKNKTAPPLRVANFVISFGIGIDKVAGIFDNGVARKIIEKAGAWMSYKDNRIGQGRAAAIEFLRGQPDMVAEIEAALRAAPAPTAAEKKAAAEDDSAPVSKKRRKPVLSEDDVPPAAEPEEEGGTTVDDA